MQHAACQEKKEGDVEVVRVILNNALMYGRRSAGMEANRSGRPSQPRPPSSCWSGTRVVFAPSVIKDDKFSLMQSVGYY